MPISRKKRTIRRAVPGSFTSTKTGSPKGVLTGNKELNKLNIPTGKERRATTKLNLSAKTVHTSRLACSSSFNSALSRLETEKKLVTNPSICLFIRTCGANQMIKSKMRGNKINPTCCVIASNPIRIDFSVFGGSGMLFSRLIIEHIFYHTSAILWSFYPLPSGFFRCEKPPNRGGTRLIFEGQTGQQYVIRIKTVIQSHLNKPFNTWIFHYYIKEEK